MVTFKRIGLAMAATALLAVASQAGNDKKTLNVGLFWMPSNIDPAVKWNGWMLPRLGIGETLIRVNEKLEFEPSIAKSWKVIDAKSVAFEIKDNVFFHDGNKLTPKDVKNSIERALKTTSRKDVKFPLKSISIDGNKLTVKTSEPFPTLINILADAVFTIVSGYDKEGFVSKPIATGPFKVVSYDSKKGISLVKHDKYRSDVGVDNVEGLLMKDGSTRTMALQSGELQLTTQLSANDLELLEKSGKFNVQKGPNARIFMARFNLDKPYMQNHNFRKALIHAVDKDGIAKNVVKGFVAKGPFPPAFDFAYKAEEPYKYNAETAKKLLDDAKIVDNDGDGIREYKGKNIILEFYARTGHGANAKNSGIAIQSMLKKIGIGVKVNQVKSFGDILKNGDYDIVWERWTAAPTLDPLYFLQSSFSKGATGNRGGYDNPEYDKMVSQLRSETDTTKRKEIAQKLIKTLLVDAPAIFVYHGLGSIVTSKNVSGVYRFPTEVIYIDHRVKMQ